MDIKTIVQSYLNGHGYTLPDGYSIVKSQLVPISPLESVGILTLAKNEPKISYLIEYKALMSLHGSGVDDLCEITCISVL